MQKESEGKSREKVKSRVESKENFREKPEEKKKEVKGASVKIILDTNFLIIPKSLGIDVLSEFDRLFGTACYELLMFERSGKELENLLDKYKGHKRQEVQFAIRFLEFLKKSKGLKILHSQENLYIDNQIVSFIKMLERSERHYYYVASVDGELKKRLFDIGSKVIDARKMKFLFIREQ
jgi:rRNA-processing protein FCF1